MGPHFLANGVVIGVRKQTLDDWTLGCAPLLHVVFHQALGQEQSHTFGHAPWILM